MRFKIGDKVRVVNCCSGGNFDDGDIVTIKQIGCDDEDDVYGAISPYDNTMWFLTEEEVEAADCEYCRGEKFIAGNDRYENVSINKNGELTVTIAGEITSVESLLKFCPMCGRPF